MVIISLYAYSHIQAEAELQQLLQEDQNKSDGSGSSSGGGRLTLLCTLLWERRYLLLVVAGAFCNALRCLFSKVVTSSLDPVLISFTERAMMMLCTVPAILYHRHSLKVPPIIFALVGITGILSAVQMMLVMVSYKYLFVADASAIVSCNPALIGFFGWIFLSEKLTYIDICACVFAIVGIMTLSRPTQLFNGLILQDHSLLYGFLAASGGAVSVSIGALFRRILCLKKVEVQVSIFYTNLISSTICAATCTILGVWEYPTSHVTQGLLIGSGVLGYVGNLLMMIALWWESVYHVSLIGTSSTAMTYMLQFIALAVVPDVYSLVGAGCVSLGVIFITLRKKKDEENVDENETESIIGSTTNK